MLMIVRGGGGGGKAKAEVQC